MIIKETKKDGRSSNRGHVGKAGRKPLPVQDLKKPLTIYVQESVIKALGGVAYVRADILFYLERRMEAKRAEKASKADQPEKGFYDR
jgi:hypothetical protein